MKNIHTFNDFLQKSLQKRNDTGLHRKLIFTEGLIDFSSNDYLGFARNTSFQNNFPQTFFLNGSTGSRLITGNSQLAEQTEQLIANFHGTEAALIFNTGYMANIGLFSSLGDIDSVFIYDAYIHASVHDGMRLSRAKRVKFKHNDLENLAFLLQNTEGGKKYVAVESVYSMDGDLAPLRDIADICQKNNAALIVDEAHGTGCFGEKGEGLVTELGLENAVFARVHTFGKALGVHGAAVIGSRLLRDFLINHARSFIYTTALPPLAYRHIQHAYQLLPAANRAHLSALIAYFIQKTTTILLPDGYFLTNANSPIQGIIMPNNEKIMALAKHLHQNGIYAKAILSPTVPIGVERIRICLHNFNTFAELDLLFSALKNG